MQSAALMRPTYRLLHEWAHLGFVTGARGASIERRVCVRCGHEVTWTSRKREGIPPCHAQQTIDFQSLEWHAQFVALNPPRPIVPETIPSVFDLG